MHRIASKVHIMMVLTIIAIGVTASNGDRRTSSHRHRTQNRTRHHRSNGSSSSSYSATMTTEELEADFMRHYLVVNSSQWSCGAPKPRIVHISEAIGGMPTIQPHMNWLSTSVVLHRCSNDSGCCTPHTSCTAVASEEVTITFKARNENTQVHSYPQHRFQNHTRCECT